MPWFVNWDDYKTNFEQEATRILGHPVQVLGSANASILPSPSLSFTNVRVGQPGGEAMMTVDRFEVTIELTPLLQGEIRVTSMRLDRPVVHVGVDGEGTIAWLARETSGELLNPDRVALANVAINDGALSYADARTGVKADFSGITAAVEARSLAGPWRVDGSYIDDGVAVPFSLGSGRMLDDGTIRVTASASPHQWPVDIATDGVIANNADTGMSYSGTYTATELVENVTGDVIGASEQDAGGWHSEGTFDLTSERLRIGQAVLSNGPPDRPSSVAGSAELTFGDAASFTASIEARQIDLDRTLGGGPNEPVDVAVAGDQLVAWLRTIPAPPVPGQIAFNVPAIVVGGSVIQDVAFSAATVPDGWEVSGLRARLPGQATFAADGLIRTSRNIGFAGTARLVVDQPATFASWWRGRTGVGGGGQLAAFDISGKADIAPGRISLDDIDARIGGAAIAGRFAWTGGGNERRLGADLTADRIDFAQVEALGRLLLGRDLGGIQALADNYSLRLAAESLRYNDIDVSDVAVDAGFAGDTLNVVQFSVGDIAGASFRVTSGRIEGLTTNPRGHLDARLEVENVDGLAAIAGRLMPGSGVVEWLGRTAEVSTPAYVDARISARSEEEGGIAISLGGVAGATSFNTSLASQSARAADWLTSHAEVSIALQSPDSAALARQVGFAAVVSDADPGSMIDLRASGVPGEGLDTVANIDFSGLRSTANGAWVVTRDAPFAFVGTFDVQSDDVAVPLATAGLLIPGAGGLPLEAAGTLSVSGGAANITWTGGRIGERIVGGALTVGRSSERPWRLDGELSADVVDFGWLSALSLGFSPLEESGSDAAWSAETFGPPGYGSVSGKLAVKAGRFELGSGLAVANAVLAVALQPQRIDIDLSSGDVAGGRANGGVSIHNVDGNAAVSGQFSLVSAALESLVWRQEERAVATGLFDLSASFEATGQSPQALVSSMTGGGVISVSGAEARYVDLAPAVQQIIRASDLGQEFTEDSLRITLGEQIGANPLAVGEAGGAFTLAAGVARLRGISLRGNNLMATGNAAADLNSMSIDSDWTFAFDAGDDKVEGVDPSVGIVFRGPITRPVRTIDALGLGSYLNTRREARILEVIALEEASRAERVRLERLLVKLDQDVARTERLEREAAEREAARRERAREAARAAFGLHAATEVRSDERRSDALQQIAAAAAAARDAAEDAARAAAAAAAADRDRAESLAAVLPALLAADTEAAGNANTSTIAYTDASTAADAAGAAAAQASASADEAQTLAQAAASAAASAAEAAATATAARNAADADLAAASAALDAANAAGERARADSASAQTALDAAGAAAAAALRAHDDALAAEKEASALRAERTGAAERAERVRADAAQRALTADAERARAQTAVNMARASAEKAAEDRDSAAEHLGDMEAQLAAATTALATATSDVEDAVRLAEIMAGDPLSDQQTVTSARGLVTAVKLRQAARQADVDRLQVEVANARTALENSERALADAGAALELAESESASANQTAAEAQAAADAANAAFAEADRALAVAITAHDAATAATKDREAEARAAGTAFDAAQARATEAAEAASAATAAIATATVRRDELAAIADGKGREADRLSAEASQSAAARDAAMANAERLRQIAGQAGIDAEAAAAAFAALKDDHDAALAAAANARQALTDAETAARAAAEAARASEAAAAEAAAVAAARAEEAEIAEARLQTGYVDDYDAPGAAVIRRPLSLSPDLATGAAQP